jgi:Ca2+-transporting ATPase
MPTPSHPDAAGHAGTRGLSSAQAAQRLLQQGPNTLPAASPVTLPQRLMRQLRSPLIYILLGALLIDLGLWLGQGGDGVPAESLAIALILVLNAGLGVYQESKAEAALARLKKLASSLTWVMRDGRLQHLSGTELVTGDVVRIEAGDRIPADGALTEAQGVMVDESILTGESLPVDKQVADETFSGTLLVRGKGYAEVTRTGSASAMGKLATLIGGIEAETTPLERRLNVFGTQIAKSVLALTVLLLMGGLLIEGLDRLGHIFLFSVALAVAAIPEGLPAVLTLALALGVERMAKKQAVVRRLSAVEALGSVTVIATDKTGTLTENHMHVKGVDSPDEARALRAMVLANDAEIDTGAGDPLEVALLAHARMQGVDATALRQQHPRLGVLPFDSASRFMRVTVGEQDRCVSYLKGAPEVLLGRSRFSGDERQHWETKALQRAAEGYRVLALAASNHDNNHGMEDDRDLDFLGLLLLWDPPRAEVPDAIALAHAAGIRVLMITGDHPATAGAVARAIGIEGERVLAGADLDSLSAPELATAVRHVNVFARMTPEHKLRLVEALKADGEIVAMTGDGVNDAPALKRSDVGIAMGQRGSDVTREVADLVLLDDNFATIVSAVEEGRGIYENIQKFIRFLFSTNLAMVLLVVLGLGVSYTLGLQETTGGLFLPLTAVQLLWINVITDGLPALALALDRNPGVMQHRPRPAKSPLLDGPSLRFILQAGIIAALAGVTLLVALPQFGYSPTQTRTAVFMFEGLVELAFVYSARRVSVLPLPNLALHAAVVIGGGLQIATVFIPGLGATLGLERVDAPVWAAIAAAVLLCWGAAEIIGRRSFAPRLQASNTRLPSSS